MRIAILYILCFLLCAAPIAASSDGGTTSPFILGSGARDLALGGAGIATADPSTAPFWNASRLAQAEQTALSGFHSNLYESDVMYQYLGVVIPTLDLGCFGLGVFRLGIDGIEKRDASNLLLGEINDNRLAFYAAYGRVVSGYDVGLAITVEHHSLDDYSATSSPGLNLSAGRRFELGSERFHHISVALNGRNLIQPSFKLADESISYPYTLAAGVSAGLKLKPEWDQTATVSAALTKADWVAAKLSLGLEYGFGDLLYLRGGLNDGRLAVGAGLKYKAMSFDYALVDRDLGSLHTFSLTTSFGKSISEKRRLKQTKREVEFNKLMNNRLLEQNRDMLSELVRDGQGYLDAGNLIEASNSLDRALFLARGSDVDTIPIHELALEVKGQLADVERLQRLNICLDSAKAKLETGDYLVARHFANLGLAEEPNSEQARNLLDGANAAIEEMTSRKEMIDNHLLAVDSLLSYGHIEQALLIASGLKPFAADNPGIDLALRRAKLEQWMANAITAQSHGDYSKAVFILDSALVLFPGHQRCLKLRDQVTSIIEHPAEPTTVEQPVLAEPLSNQLRKQVDDVYAKARSSFERGELSQAIELWEKVERLAPDYQSVREYLVNAYKFVGVDLYSQNQLDEAVTVWKKAIKLAPDNKEIKGYINRTETEIRKMDELTYEY